jgi:hypothetical protein
LKVMHPPSSVARARAYLLYVCQGDPPYRITIFHDMGTHCLLAGDWLGLSKEYAGQGLPGHADTFEARACVVVFQFLEVSLSCVGPSAMDAPDEKKDEAGFSRGASWR